MVRLKVSKEAEKESERINARSMKHSVYIRPRLTFNNADGDHKVRYMLIKISVLKK